jgi:hypothetical protein
VVVCIAWPLGERKQSWLPGQVNDVNKALFPFRAWWRDNGIWTTPKQELEQRECEYRREKTSAPSRRLESGTANALNVQMQRSKPLKA